MARNALLRSKNLPSKPLICIFTIRPLAVIQRDNPVYFSPAYGALLRFGEGPITFLTGTHVTALKKHAGALVTQAYCACSRRHITLRQVELL